MVGSASGPGSRLHLRYFSGLHGFGSHFQIKYGSGSVLNFWTREDLYSAVKREIAMP